MNEAETRAEYIDPKLKASGWGEVEGLKFLKSRQKQIPLEILHRKRRGTTLE